MSSCGHRVPVRPVHGAVRCDLVQARPQIPRYAAWSMLVRIDRFVRPLAVAALACVTFAACNAQKTTGEGTHEGERTANVSQALTSNQLFGTSLAAKRLSLTFDDGPGDRTAELSTYLKNQGIRATFFINGGRVAATALPNPNGVTPTANAAAILDQIADGHLLANHTTTHRDVTGVPAGQLVQELSETDAYVAARIPANRFLFRAPFGSWNASAYNTLHASAMDKYVGPVYWEAGGISDGYPSAAADWACWQGQLKNTNGTPANGTGYATTAQCGDAYITEINAFNKGIVLLHDPYGWAQGHTVDMVKYMVPKLKAAGYTFVRLDQVPAIATQLPCDATCGTCTGPEPTQCTSCGAGRYLQGGECKPCTVCADGTYQAVACAANADTVCAACDGTCATCTGGGANACSTCAAARYLAGTACPACSVCAAGTYEATACTATTNTVCTACDATCATCTGPAPTDCASCKAGSWRDGTECKTCTQCAAGTYAATACSADADTVCAPCNAACATCFGPGATECGSCPPGTFSKAGGQCQTCATCEAGAFAKTACSAKADTVCAPCAAGTYAPKGSTSCAPCAAGTFAKAGAAACTACGSCDDGDACTTDKCDATNGCVHEPIPGCAPGTPPSTTDGGIIDDGQGNGVGPEDEGGCAVGGRAPSGSSLTLWAIGAALALRSRRRRVAGSPARR